MTQKEQLLELFSQNGNKLSLGQMLSHPSGIGYKATSRFSELRKMGYRITLVFQDHDNPSNNLYELIEPLEFDSTGSEK